MRARAARARSSPHRSSPRHPPLAHRPSTLPARACLGAAAAAAEAAARRCEVAGAAYRARPCSAWWLRGPG
eukprot:scaffold119517_cov69-Phaeocystis_antarctica.AAC.4